MNLIQFQSGLGTAQGSGTVRQSVLVFSILILVQTAPNRGWSDIAIYNLHVRSAHLSCALCGPFTRIPTGSLLAGPVIFPYSGNRSSLRGGRRVL
jgi:hypothetical protein